MSREPQPSGFLLVDKPAGITSHDVIDELRKITGIKKIGHAGTLDPLATGLLLVAVGKESTKKISQFVGLDKEYEAVIKLGAVSDTYDAEGKINDIRCRVPDIGCRSADIKKILTKFTGPQKQLPPAYSAKKVKGKKMYELARKGIEVKREPIDITIHELELINYNWPELEIKVKCSSGTYIRSLAHDIGEALGCGGYLLKLKRTAIGPYLLSQSKPLNEISLDNWPTLAFFPKL